MTATTPQAATPRVLELEGDLDELEIENLKAVLDDYGDEPLLVLDLSRVTYLSSLAVSAIVNALRRARARGHELTVQVKRDTIPERVLFITAIPYRAI
ncbi:STAS domain-containing protein [Nocardioides pantholopis]|uniref:STAS domain-containing protein n=1 Tax=Nocardioides pantholopis TaxID=2483798 RepID=UPI000F07E912|nr:STAS domain-containing protein [Nocardioides pantholopis]